MRKHGRCDTRTDAFEGVTSERSLRAIYAVFKPGMANRACDDGIGENETCSRSPEDLGEALGYSPADFDSGILEL